MTGDSGGAARGVHMAVTRQPEMACRIFWGILSELVAAALARNKTGLAYADAGKLRWELFRNGVGRAIA